jgi:hypothetical protein
MAVFRTVALAAADVGLVAPPYEYAVVGGAAVVPEEPLDDFDELPHAEKRTTARTTTERLNLRATATSPDIDPIGVPAERRTVEDRRVKTQYRWAEPSSASAVMDVLSALTPEDLHATAHDPEQCHRRVGRCGTLGLHRSRALGEPSRMT